MRPEETIDFYLKTTWQGMANTYNAIASEYGITQSTGYVLIHVHEEGTAVSQVASLLGVKATSLSRILTGMEKLGLVYKKADAIDKRSVKVFLTDLGKEKRQVAKKVVRKFNEYLNQNISEDDRIKLIETLKTINQFTLAYKPGQ